MRKNPHIDEYKAAYHEQALHGLARTLWVLAVADYSERQQEYRDENGEDDETEAVIERPRSGGDWDDVTPPTPLAARLCALTIAKYIAKTEGIVGKYPLADLYELARTVDDGEAYEFEEIMGSDSGRYRTKRRAEVDLFGSYLAHMAMGTGASWFDDHKHKNMGAEWDPKWTSRFEINYDGQTLSWSGGGGHGALNAFYEGPDEECNIGDDLGDLVVVNQPSEGSGRYVLWFGAPFAAEKLLVHTWRSDGFQNALEEAVDWIVDNRPGLLADDEVREEYDRLKKEKVAELGRELDDEEEYELQDEAAVDTTMFGHNGLHWINSDEWGIVAENPNDDELLEIAGLIDDAKPNPGGNAPPMPPRRGHGKIKVTPYGRDPNESDTLPMEWDPYTGSPVQERARMREWQAAHPGEDWRDIGWTANPPKATNAADHQARFLFKETITARMLRLLLIRGAMPQAEFMREYMAAADRQPSVWSSRARRKASPAALPSGFLNNFGRLVTHSGWGSREGSPNAAPRVIAQDSSGGRALLRWAGLPLAELLATMSDPVLQWAYESMEHEMVAPERPTASDPEELGRWAATLRGEIERRGVKTNPTKHYRPVQSKR